VDQERDAERRSACLCRSPKKVLRRERLSRLGMARGPADRKGKKGQRDRQHPSSYLPEAAGGGGDVDVAERISSSAANEKKEMSEGLSRHRLSLQGPD